MESKGFNQSSHNHRLPIRKVALRFGADFWGTAEHAIFSRRCRSAGYQSVPSASASAIRPWPVRYPPVSSRMRPPFAALPPKPQYPKSRSLAACSFCRSFWASNVSLAARRGCIAERATLAEWTPPALVLVEGLRWLPSMTRALASYIELPLSFDDSQDLVRY